MRIQKYSWTKLNWIKQVSSYFGWRLIVINLFCAPFLRATISRTVFFAQNHPISDKTKGIQFQKFWGECPLLFRKTSTKLWLNQNWFFLHFFFFWSSASFPAIKPKIRNPLDEGEDDHYSAPRGTYGKRGRKWPGFPGGEFVNGVHQRRNGDSYPAEKPAACDLGVQVSGWMFHEVTQWPSTQVCWRGQVMSRSPKWKLWMGFFWAAVAFQRTPKPDESVFVAGSMVFTPPSYEFQHKISHFWWSWVEVPSWRHSCEGPDQRFQLKGEEPKIPFRLVHILWWLLKSL